LDFGDSRPKVAFYIVFLYFPSTRIADTAADIVTHTVTMKYLRDAYAVRLQKEHEMVSF